MDIKNLERARDIQNDVEVLDILLESVEDGDLFFELNERGGDFSESSVERIKKDLEGILIGFKEQLLEEVKTL